MRELEVRCVHDSSRLGPGQLRLRPLVCFRCGSDRAHCRRHVHRKAARRSGPRRNPGSRRCRRLFPPPPSRPTPAAGVRGFRPAPSPGRGGSIAPRPAPTAGAPRPLTVPPAETCCPAGTASGSAASGSSARELRQRRRPRRGRPRGLPGGSGGRRYACVLRGTGRRRQYRRAVRLQRQPGGHLPQPRRGGRTLRTALTILLGGSDAPAGLYNSLDSSDLEYVSAYFDGTTVVVNLTGTVRPGGICDIPRLEAQLTHTAVSAVGASRAEIYVDGRRLADVLSLR